MVRRFNMSAVMFSRHLFNLLYIQPFNELHADRNNNLLERSSKNFHLCQKRHANRQDKCLKQKTKARTGCSPEATRVCVQMFVQKWYFEFQLDSIVLQPTGGNTMQVHKS